MPPMSSVWPSGALITPPFKTTTSGRSRPTAGSTSRGARPPDEHDGGHAVGRDLREHRADVARAAHDPEPRLRDADAPRRLLERVERGRRGERVPARERERVLDDRAAVVGDDRRVA